jgi:hypothetical protein
MGAISRKGSRKDLNWDCNIQLFRLLFSPQPDCERCYVQTCSYCRECNSPSLSLSPSSLSREVGSCPHIHTNHATKWLDQARGEWSALRSGRFTPRERPPSTHWIGGWVGSRADLDAVVKRKIPRPPRKSNPITPIIQPVVQRYTDWIITAPLSTVGVDNSFCSPVGWSQVPG